MMETIRVTADEQRRIAQAAAASPHKNKQRFCLAAIMGAVQVWEERPIPEGCVRLHPFQQPALDIARQADTPLFAVEAKQYQTDGHWYFSNDKGDVIGMREDAQMQKHMPNPGSGSL